MNYWRLLRVADGVDLPWPYGSQDFGDVREYQIAFVSIAWKSLWDYGAMTMNVC